MVSGMNREYNVAVVIPDYEVLKGWAAEKGLDLNPVSLAKNDQVRALIEEEVEKLSAEFKGYEKVRRIYIGDEDFTTDNGMLTPTLKLKRRIVQQRYNDAIESLYV
jgi:long-chain acyl-CoA synthetase